MILPRGMDKEELIELLGDAWELVGVESAVDASAPPPIRRAGPTLYHLKRDDTPLGPDGSSHSASGSG